MSWDDVELIIGTGIRRTSYSFFIDRNRPCRETRYHFGLLDVLVVLENKKVKAVWIAWKGAVVTGTNGPRLN
jgi:hypothetical protein